MVKSIRIVALFFVVLTSCAKNNCKNGQLQVLASCKKDKSQNSLDARHENTESASKKNTGEEIGPDPNEGKNTEEEIVFEEKKMREVFPRRKKDLP